MHRPTSKTSRFQLRLHPNERAGWEAIAAALNCAEMASAVREIMRARGRELGIEWVEGAPPATKKKKRRARR